MAVSGTVSRSFPRNGASRPRPGDAYLTPGKAALEFGGFAQRDANLRALEQKASTFLSIRHPNWLSCRRPCRIATRFWFVGGVGPAAQATSELCCFQDRARRRFAGRSQLRKMASRRRAKVRGQLAAGAARGAEGVATAGNPVSPICRPRAGTVWPQAAPRAVICGTAKILPLPQVADGGAVRPGCRLPWEGKPSDTCIATTWVQ